MTAENNETTYVDLATDREYLDSEMKRIREKIDQGPYSADWESLQKYQIPEWYRASKFGIFIHWGVYSVPAFGNEWYPREMYRVGSKAYEHHRKTYGDQKEFGYKDFIDSFTMEDFDPDSWSDLFYRSGAQFVVPVAEHHDGFTLYDEELTRWKAPEKGPKRDVFGDLCKSLNKRQLVPGASSHRAEHWFFFDGGARFDSDVRDIENADLYGPALRQETGPNEAFLENWLIRTVHIIDEYRPQVLWFDWWIEHPAFEPYLRMLAAYYYNVAAEWGRGVVINYKWDAFAPGSAVFDVERGNEEAIRPDLWQNDTSVSRTSWGYIDGHLYKSAKDIIDELVDIVAKNGVLLLNVGPKPDGTIPDEEKKLLEGVGDWLSINGEAIYGTVPWKVFGAGPTTVEGGSFTDSSGLDLTSEDFRFTFREFGDISYLYVTSTEVPEGGTVKVPLLGKGQHLVTGEIEAVHLLGHDRPIPFEWNSDELVVQLPEVMRSNYGYSLRLSLREVPAQKRSGYLHDNSIHLEIDEMKG